MNPDRVAIGVVNTLFGGRFTSKLNTAPARRFRPYVRRPILFDQRRLGRPVYHREHTLEMPPRKRPWIWRSRSWRTPRESITAEELASAKAYLKGQFPTSIETSSQLASTIARLEFYGLDENDINSTIRDRCHDNGRCAQNHPTVFPEGQSRLRPDRQGRRDPVPGKEVRANSRHEAHYGNPDSETRPRFLMARKGTKHRETGHSPPGTGGVDAHQ